MTKRLLFLCALVLSAMGVSAQAVIKFDKTTHDFGTFSEKKVQKYVFTVTNEGKEPLVLQQVFASCGCTATDFTKEPIQPGEKGAVMVTYNGAGRFPGHFRKPITIRSNATVKTSRIYIEGTMLPEETK